MKKRALVVEDDRSLARLLIDNLAYDGFDVEWVADGAAATAVARRFTPDVVLLDLTLPNLDGLDICRALSRKPRMAIIILTVRAQTEDKIRGLELGADDYVTKPFALKELLARVHAVLRRRQSALTPIDRLLLGPTVVDFRRCRVVRNGVQIALTHRELDVLRYLAERPGEVVSREELLRVVWGYSESSVTRTVDNSVARLRRKIEADPHHPRFIRTAYGDGYLLELPA